jgi:hypothetical protein
MGRVPATAVAVVPGIGATPRRKRIGVRPRTIAWIAAAMLPSNIVTLAFRFVTFVCAFVTVVFMCVAATGAAPAQPPLIPLEEEAARILADDHQPFVARGDLADRLKAALQNPDDPELRGRLALLWVRAVRRTLEAIPMTVDGTRQEPFRTWLEDHETDVVYSEPAGQWLLDNTRLWKLHDEHRQSAAAEPLAWEAVENGLPGECEGYPPCYLSGLNRLEGEYLRRHPAGRHAAEAAERIRESCQQSLELIGTQKPREFFTPATDCQDLRPPADDLRAALATARIDARDALGLLARLRAQCP